MPREPLDPQASWFIYLFIHFSIIIYLLSNYFFVYFAGLGEKELEVLAERVENVLAGVLSMFLVCAVLAERVENVLAGSDSEKVSALVHLPCKNAIERRKKVHFLERTRSSI
jgi:hypothetical protein